MFNKKLKQQVLFLTDRVYDLEKKIEKMDARVSRLERGEIGTDSCNGLYPQKNK